MTIDKPIKSGNLATNLIKAMNEQTFSLGDKLAFIELLDATRDSKLTQDFLSAMDGGEEIKVDATIVEARPKPLVIKP